MKIINSDKLFKIISDVPMYDNQDREIFLDIISDVEEDPIHVTGGVYCEECVYYKSYEFPESNKKIYQCYNQCASYLEERKPYDFCSRGKKK